ncbi:MAG: transketolase, partial [Planctomycetes bacterium]|nr:transketolase [Planctomycetota bacterium]
ALILTRQSLPVLKQTQLDTAANFDKGAYVLVKNEKPDVLLIATGSEVSLAVDACEKLSKENIKACVISMPSWKLFEKQTKEYQDSVLLPGVKVRIAVEAGIKQGWEKWLGENGVFIGMSSFGASAPGNVCFEKFGITSEKIVEAAKKIIKKSEKDKAK